MKRSFLVVLAAIGVAPALLPAPAAAQIIELGATPRTPLAAPVCPPGVRPQNCTIVLTQVTGLETVTDGLSAPTAVSTAGNIVAFTLGLSRLDSNLARARRDVHFLDSTYGGTTQAAISVLKPVGQRRFRRWAVVAQSPVYHLQPYLGQVVQFPLATSLPVTRGEVVALTVPTWAPVLSFNLPPNKFEYRQSRSANCNHPAAANRAQTTIGASTRYVCDYPGTRVQYSATEVTTPVPPKVQIHTADRGR
jgi:hypothetical protein